MKKKGLFALLLFLILGGGLFSYLLPSQNLCTKIPVIFPFHSCKPLVITKVQGKNYFLLLDLGACNSLYFNKNILTQLDKKITSNQIAISDVRGNIYNWPVYNLPRIEVGPLAYSNYNAVEESSTFHENTTLWPSQTQTSTADSHGRIGWPFFKDLCCLIDFPNSSILLTETFGDLKLDLQNFISVPFSIEPEGLVLTVEIDLVKHRVVLDTGTSFSVLQKPEQNESYLNKNLFINNYSFGNWTFALSEFSENVNIDGIIGSDFFLEHAICIDFRDQIAYIKKPEKNPLAVQWKRAKHSLTQYWMGNFSNLTKVEAL